jgi:hypothetical protein
MEGCMSGWVMALSCQRTKLRDLTLSFPCITFAHNFLKYHEEKLEYWIKTIKTICRYVSQYNDKATGLTNRDLWFSSWSRQRESLQHCVQTSSRAHLASYQMGTHGKIAAI